MLNVHMCYPFTVNVGPDLSVLKLDDVINVVLYSTGEIVSAKVVEITPFVKVTIKEQRYIVFPTFRQCDEIVRMIAHA
jgi:hypothetical protein